MEPLRPEDPRLIGSYRLEGRLGAGGMGEVFLGASPSGRKVAVKVVRAQYAADPEFRTRFAREIEAARRVGGFHTAQVVDADPEAPSPWMVTAFVPGPSLRQVVMREGPLAPGAVRALGAGLAEGLAAIHACGLVHRDLKPGNVIMSPDGPRIIDFGIARATDATAMTSTGTVVGTFSFMSPEQVRADVTGPPSDVFSLGCVLAYAATGRGPFDAATIPAIVHRIVGGAPDLAGLTADPALSALISRCLEKDPARRPPVREVLAGLNAAPPRPPRRMSRRTLLLGAAAGATAAVGVPAALLLTGNTPAFGGREAPRTPIGTPTELVLPSGAVDIHALHFSADGRTLLGAGFDDLWRWDLTTGQGTALHDEVPYKNFRRPMAFSPDGRTLATSGEDKGVHLWDVASWKVRKSFAKGAEIEALAFGPDGRSLAVSGGSGPAFVQVWDTVTGRTTRMKTDRPVRSLAFSPDGERLAGAGSSRGFVLWNVEDGAATEVSADGDASALAFSPDGRTLAVAYRAYWRIELRDADGGLDETFPKIDGEVETLAFSPDGDTLVSVDREKTRLWHVPDRRVTATLPVKSENGQVIVFSPDGRRFATSSKGTTRLWTFG